MTNKENNKQNNTDDSNEYSWLTWGIREYQELAEENTKKVLQFWTDVYNFWWDKK